MFDQSNIAKKPDKFLEETRIAREERENERRMNHSATLIQVR